MDNNLQDAASRAEVENIEPVAAAETQEVTKDNPQEVEEKTEIAEEIAGNEDEEIKDEPPTVETRKVRQKLSRERIRENLRVYKTVDYSGFIERLFARGVDFLLTAAFGYFTYRKFGLNTAIVSCLLFDLAVRIVFTYFLGATVGKFIFGVRVISRCSGKLSIWQVIIRELSKYLSGAALNLGYVSIIASRRKKAWHDIIACTAVTSGGRQEAEYARDIYKERPEKWYVYIGAPIIIIFIAALLISVNKGSDYFINQVGMIGFTKAIDSKGVEFKYSVPPQNLGLAGINKNIIQVGDIDGDKGIEIFKEGIKDSKTVIKTLRITATKPVDGDAGIECEKPVIQYRLADINGDKKDELAVLYEDRVLKLYKLDGEQPVEISSIGPLQYNEITAFVKGKVSNTISNALFVMGDKKKVSILTMNNGKMEEQKLELSGEYNFVSFDTGLFSDKHYVVGASNDGKLVFYKLEEGTYKKDKELLMPVNGNFVISVKDLDCDGKNEVVIMSPAIEEEKGHVLAAYDVSGDIMKLKWDGGKSYKNVSDKVALVFDDGYDIDSDGRMEAYAVSRKVSGREGRSSLIIFESDKYLLKLNDLLRMAVFYNAK